MARFGLMSLGRSLRISRLALVVALIVAAAGVYLVIEEGSDGVPSGDDSRSDASIGSTPNSEVEVDAYHTNVPAIPGGDVHRVPAGYDVPGVVELPEGAVYVVPTGSVPDVVVPTIGTAYGIVPDVQAIVCAYPWDCATAMRIVDCETGGTFNIYAVGRADERGWFQIHPTHWDKPQCEPDRLFDPVYNAACAYSIWLVQGWQPWSCY